MKLKYFFLLLFASLVTINLCGQKSTKKITVTGIVNDINGKPVPGAAIVIDNKNTGRITGANGFYKVKVKSDAEMISVRLPSGHITETLYNGQAEVNFSLPVDISLETYNINDPGEEEINVGYGTVKKKNLTQSVGKIDGSNKRFASYTSIYEMIKGEVPGVQVNGTSITIQGIHSINLSNEPLFVVDGMVVSSIDHILPVMVRSIEVLKGSSTAIYGSRGANGVILITLVGAKDIK